MSSALKSVRVPNGGARLRVKQWSLAPFDSQLRVKRIFSRVQGTRYPVKMLRYWFMYQLLASEAARLGRPIRVCEIGVDRGQMLMFAQDAGALPIERWDAVDVKPTPELLSRGYSSIIHANVEDEEFRLEHDYDAVITLHLLEHLYHPERVVSKIASGLKPGGILIGGYPVTPRMFAGYWERRLRVNAKPFRHVSVFSPERTLRMATDAGLEMDFCSGSFLVRRTGFFLENYQGWVRFNLAFGSSYPSLGGELYWCMRKPSAAP